MPYISPAAVENVVEQIVELMAMAQENDICPYCGEDDLSLITEAHIHKVVRCRNCHWEYCNTCGKTSGILSLEEAAIKVIKRAETGELDSFVSIWR